MRKQDLKFKEVIASLQKQESEGVQRILTKIIEEAAKDLSYESAQNLPFDRLKVARIIDLSLKVDDFWFSFFAAIDNVPVKKFTNKVESFLLKLCTNFGEIKDNYLNQNQKK